MEKNSVKSSRNKVQQSILSFVKSKQVKSRISETRIGSQNFEVRMMTLQRYRKSRRKVDRALLPATKIRVKIISYTQNQNYRKA